MFYNPDKRVDCILPGHLQVVGKSYDEIYVESWKAALTECDKQLEPLDRIRALEVKTSDDFRTQLDRLLEEYPDEDQAPRYVILLLYPTLDHYQQFTQTFIDMMAAKVETSMLWGLLYLVLKLSLESRGTIAKVSRMLEEIGYKLRRLNECCLAISNMKPFKGDTVEINREIITLWLNVIMLFRNQAQSAEFDESQRMLESLSQVHNDAMRTIGDAVSRIEKAMELTERQARLINEEILQKMMALSTSQNESVQLPCAILPVARNARFFGRKKILEDIDRHLTPSDTSQGLKSLGIYGLGGIGKTQVALEYAYSKQNQVDAVLRVPAETTLSLQQGFTRIAIEGLKLPGTDPQAHLQNMLLVVSWLRKTAAKWILIFDNVESHSILENCWPAANHGAILVTTRRHGIVSQPIDQSLEIITFPSDEGTEFVLHLLKNPQYTEAETSAAKELCQKLNGYALAISQMAAYINSRTMSIQSFLALYNKYPKRLHQQRKDGWKYIGYDHSLDTVWNISFDALDKPATTCISLFSFYSPDAIPADLLEPDPSLELPRILDFCQDELSRWDAIEQLTAQGLVKHDPASRSFSLHRLVQAQCLFRMSEGDRQDAFDSAIKLLLDKFPSRGNLVNMDSLWEDGAKYLEQIAAAAKNWHESQEKPEALKPTIDFCNLMADCAWFVHDNDSAGIMNLVIDTGYEAYKKLKEDLKQPILQADILLLLCVRDLKHSVDFASAEANGMESLKIRHRLGMPEDVRMTSCYNYLAVGLDSVGRHKEAQNWLQKSRDILVQKDDEVHVRLLCQNNLNYSRNLFSIGDFKSSEKKLNEGQEQATFFESWYSLAFVHETKANLYILWNQLEKAEKEVELARSTLEKSGTYASISWISGIVHFRASCLALAQNNEQLAIDEASKAVAIGRLYSMPPGIRSRFSHGLMKAYLRDSTKYVQEAEAARQEAQRLRRALPPGRTDLRDESDHAFDLLVDISLR